MAVQAAKHEDKKPAPPPAPKAAATQRGKALNPNPNTPDVPPAGEVLGPLLKDQPASDLFVINPLAASDVAGGFTPGIVPGSDKISAIKTDTPSYGTETPPRQTPPTSFDSAVEHGPPSPNYDANGAKIVSTAPTLTSISPNTAAAGSADVVVTATGTNFDRGTLMTFGGTAVAETTYVSATSMTFVVSPSKFTAGVVQATAKNSAGESVQRAFTFT